ncbi:transporter substrate-binding domain-containing protein [Legionella dresdenensis]|uniref:Transporter substrate-binding domain-containing protein n=1 Tax=Legionella dresdenensis TaxID=450200 RepID=A0ABV8CEE9_9GAMM
MNIWRQLAGTLLLSSILITPAQSQLNAGVIFFDPPLVISATQGFNIDMLNRICSGMQQQCNIVQLNLDEVFPALDEGKIDFFMGVFISPERARKYIFSIPYMLSQGLFITSSAKNYTSVSQLKGARVGIITEEGAAGIFHSYIRTNYPDLFTLVEYKTTQDVINALNNQDIDAAVIHATAANYWVQNSSGNLKNIGNAFTLGDGEAAIALPSQRDLIRNINVQIEKIENDGDYIEIYNNYFANSM